jgi:hypothetical protein
MIPRCGDSTADRNARPGAPSAQQIPCKGSRLTTSAAAVHPARPPATGGPSRRAVSTVQKAATAYLFDVLIPDLHSVALAVNLKAFASEHSYEQRIPCATAGWRTSYRNPGLDDVACNTPEQKYQRHDVFAKRAPDHADPSCAMSFRFSGRSITQLLRRFTSSDMPQLLNPDPTSISAGQHRGCRNPTPARNTWNRTNEDAAAAGKTGLRPTGCSLPMPARAALPGPRPVLRQ